MTDCLRFADPKVVALQINRMKLKNLTFIFLLLAANAIFLWSCGGNEDKTEEDVVENFYEDSVSASTDSSVLLNQNDSLLAAPQDSLSTKYDSTAFKLKAKLAKDTTRGNISDSLKHEIHQARDYMRNKLDRSPK